MGDHMETGMFSMYQNMTGGAMDRLDKMSSMSTMRLPKGEMVKILLGMPVSHLQCPINSLKAQFNKPPLSYLTRTSPYGDYPVICTTLG